MTTDPSLSKDGVDAVTLHATVFYDPNLYHYVSSGWDLEELLSQRVHTLTSTCVPLRLRVPFSGAEGSKVAYKLGASQLRRAALRAILISGAVGGEPEEETEEDIPIGKSDAQLEDSLEAALDRWVAFTHLHVHGGKRVQSPQPGSLVAPVQDAAPTVLVEDDEQPEDVSVSPILSSPSPLQQANTNKNMTDPSSQRKSADKAAQWPVIIPTASNVAVFLVLSLVKDAQTWRKMRRDARSASAVEPLSSPPIADGERDKPASTASCDKAQPPPAMFVSDDDAMFSQWLQSKQALRRQWRRHYGEEAEASPSVHCDEHHSTVSPPNVSGPANSAENATAASLILSRATSGSSDDDEEAVGESKTNAVKENHGGGAVDAEARRAAVLAAVERRRQR